MRLMHGRASHDPAMMVALLLYAYAVGERSSRGIERHCLEDVAFRVIAANQAYEQLAREILAEADAVDAAEDARFGDKRGDELPPELADRKTRGARLKEAKARLEAAHAAKAQELEEWEAAKAATIAHR
jgi:hypothetical protein